MYILVSPAYRIAMFITPTFSCSVSDILYVHRVLGDDIMTIVKMRNGDEIHVAGDHINTYVALRKSVQDVKRVIASRDKPRSGRRDAV